MLKWINKNIYIIGIGLSLTALFVCIAYEERGYFAYGGEYLTLPIMLLVKQLAADIKESIKE